MKYSHLYISSLGFLHSIFFSNIIYGIHTNGYLLDKSDIILREVSAEKLKDLFPGMEFNNLCNIIRYNQSKFREK